jgi:hypothetical protein
LYVKVIPACDGSIPIAWKRGRRAVVGLDDLVRPVVGSGSPLDQFSFYLIGGPGASISGDAAQAGPLRNQPGSQRTSFLAVTQKILISREKPGFFLYRYLHG